MPASFAARPTSSARAFVAVASAAAASTAATTVLSCAFLTAPLLFISISSPPLSRSCIRRFTPAVHSAQGSANYSYDVLRRHTGDQVRERIFQVSLVLRLERQPNPVFGIGELRIRAEHELGIRRQRRV